MNIYIDGSCRPSTRFGAYAVLIINEKGERTILKGTQKDVTNNVMELTALIEALRYIKLHQLDVAYEINIYSDSQYVVKGVQEWWTKWKMNNYRNSSGPIKNLELWKILEPLTVSTKCHLHWIKGHADTKEHNEVDKIVFDLTTPT